MVDDGVFNSCVHVLTHTDYTISNYYYCYNSVLFCSVMLCCDIINVHSLNFLASFLQTTKSKSTNDMQRHELNIKAILTIPYYDMALFTLGSV